MDGVLHVVLEPSLAVKQVCAGQWRDMWSMARVARSGHGMAHVPALDAQTHAKRNVPGVCLIEEGIDLLKGGGM